MTPTLNQTAEIVTFRSLPDLSEADVLRAAGALDSVLRTADGFVVRHLSRAPDGLWTDHLIWRDLPSAMSGSAAVMQDAAAAPFMAMIDPASVTMTHARLLLARQAA